MCGVGDVARYALLPGDPQRVERIFSHLDEARKVADYRGYVTYTGEAGGVGVSACSTGIGYPSAAIVVEELMRIGVETSSVWAPRGASSLIWTAGTSWCPQPLSGGRA